MTTEKCEILPLRTEGDIVRVCQAVRAVMVGQAFSLIGQTMMVTATSELSRNTLLHGGGGVARVEQLENARGLRVTFEDQGPGIADIKQAMCDGFSTVGSLGLGLGGAKRLVHEFNISSEYGHGTCVTITMFK